MTLILPACDCSLSGKKPWMALFGPHFQPLSPQAGAIPGSCYRGPPAGVGELAWGAHACLALLGKQSVGQWVSLDKHLCSLHAWNHPRDATGTGRRGCQAGGRGISVRIVTERLMQVGSLLPLHLHACSITCMKIKDGIIIFATPFPCWQWISGCPQGLVATSAGEAGLGWGECQAALPLPWLCQGSCCSHRRAQSPAA